MANYAMHDGTRVVNVLVADSAQIAEDVTGLTAVETNGVPWTDWTLHGDEWRPPAPFPSWVWNDGEWVAPVPMPTEGGPWAWDEDTLSWVEVTA